MARTSTGRGKKTKGSSTTSRAKNQDLPGTGASLEQMAALHKTGLQKHIKAANTRKKYGEGVRAGRKWLLESIGSQKSTGKAAGMEDSTNDNPDDSFKFDSPEYAHAFDDTPNEHSPKVLSLYLVFKIFHQDRKIGTADTIHAAFKDFWKMADGSKYRGRWHLNPTTGQYEGNPVESAEVEDTMRSIKNKCGADGGDRVHSLAMSKEYMEKMFAWSDSICAPATYFNPLPSPAESLERTKHLMFKAFVSTGWTVWTRNFELIKLREKDLSFGFEDPRAFNTPYFELRLTNRKGWQKKINKAQKEADLRSGKYKISSQPNLPACDAYHWLPLWRRYLQEVVYCRPLAPDDYIFPAVGANGVVQVGEHVSHDDVQKWINEFATGAQLPRRNGNFTTHCLRRGGAQYRFMFAPVGGRWTLRQVRWWGGWADGEHRDTLIKYLLDELHTYEDDYSGMLLPNQPDLDRTFLGEGSSTSTATAEQMTLMHQSLSADMRTVSSAITSLAHSFANAQGHVPTSTSTVRQPSHYPPNMHSLNHQISSHQPIPTRATRSLIPILLTQQTLCVNNNPSDSPRSSTPSPPEPEPQSRVTSTPHLVIPDIPVRLADGTRSHTRDSWRYAVKHWQEGDPARGLYTPLRDWPKGWITGKHKLTFAMKRFSRGVVATEFLTQYKSDERAFLRAYPEAEKGLSKLLDAINAARSVRGDRVRRKNLSS
ncbi:hypothetical protein GGX14DRAFT_528316 [Mycena pura]|uniref:Uncharacterized protein n=1 Tax=Mycena pura TaxID=153505 RepID=A0AAD6UQQ5_9AGAR|nr:hypothetical protein GGX14DRAFT_528316 [Mycena pura]